MTVGNLFNVPFDQRRCPMSERGWVCTAIRLAVIGGSGLLHQMAFQFRNLLSLSRGAGALSVIFLSPILGQNRTILLDVTALSPLSVASRS